VRRSVLAVDRVVCVVLGLVLVAGGLLGLGWWTGEFGLVGNLDTSAVEDATAQDAAAPVAAAAAVVLAVLALWWLVAHVPRRRVGVLALAGSGREGSLRVAADGPARAAARELSAVPGVRSAAARVVAERGRLVAQVDAVVEPSADLPEVGRAASLTRDRLLLVLGRPDVVGRVTLSVARNDHRTRVH
jgi:hypothetical protein